MQAGFQIKNTLEKDLDLLKIVNCFENSVFNNNFKTDCGYVN